MLCLPYAGFFFAIFISSRHIIYFDIIFFLQLISEYGVSTSSGTLKKMRSLLDNKLFSRFRRSSSSLKTNFLKPTFKTDLRMWHQFFCSGLQEGAKMRWMSDNNLFLKPCIISHFLLISKKCANFF